MHRPLARPARRLTLKLWHSDLRRVRAINRRQLSALPPRLPPPHLIIRPGTRKLSGPNFNGWNRICGLVGSLLLRRVGKGTRLCKCPGSADLGSSWRGSGCHFRIWPRAPRRRQRHPALIYHHGKDVILIRCQYLYERQKLNLLARACFYRIIWATSLQVIRWRGRGGLVSLLLRRIDPVRHSRTRRCIGQQKILLWVGGRKHLLRGQQLPIFLRMYCSARSDNVKIN